MQVIVLFGLPGAGKTFVGKILQEYFDFYFYDGDTSLPDNMKDAIKLKSAITDAMRDIFFQNIIKSARQLTVTHKRIAIAQTFIKEKYRKLFINQIPEARFILIHTNKTIREARLTQRKDYPLDLEYARKMYFNFDPPHIDYDILNNDIDGKTDIQKQFRLLLNRR